MRKGWGRMGKVRDVAKAPRDAPASRRRLPSGRGPSGQPALRLRLSSSSRPCARSGPRGSDPRIHLEPFAGRNLRAFGYDMLSEPTRRAAMEASRDKNKVVHSGKVLLVHETETDVQAGLLMFALVYHEAFRSRRSKSEGGRFTAGSTAPIGWRILPPPRSRE